MFSPKEDRMEKTEADKDILSSLRGLYFGDLKDPFQAAAHRAYRDFNRTLEFQDKDSQNKVGKKATEERKRICADAIEILQNAFSSLTAEKIKSQEDYDAWHRETAREIIDLYEDFGVEFYYGQAQKWINMTAKYLYLLGERDFDGVFKYLHVPVDNYVLEIGFEQFGFAKHTKAWSQWSEEEYFRYQNKLRANIKDVCPLRWEFRSWLAAARSHKEE